MENLAGAAAAWKRASRNYDRSKVLRRDEHTFFRACCHAGLAGLAGRPDSGVSAAEGADQAEKAMAVLRQAVTMGYRNDDVYRTESALDPLRNRPDFQAPDDGPRVPDRAVRAVSIPDVGFRFVPLESGIVPTAVKARMVSRSDGYSANLTGHWSSPVPLRAHRRADYSQVASERLPEQPHLDLHGARCGRSFARFPCWCSL